MGEKVPPHETPMVSGSIKDEGFSADLTEHPDRYIVSTSDITLHLYKENFKMKIYDKNGSLVTESGSRTHNEFTNATDAFPMGFVKNRKPKKLYAVENFNLQPGEAIYGLGEKFGPFIFLFLGPTHAIDFSKKEGITWYKEKLKGLFDLGASVIKVDFGEQIQPHQEFSKYSGREMPSSGQGVFPDGDKPLEYTLHDELGSVQFRGKMKGKDLTIKITHFPKNREKLKIEVKLPPGHKDVRVEIISK
jgi:alpha-glucosidase (family GH31 glycosyl hydrolase)